MSTTPAPAKATKSKKDKERKGSLPLASERLKSVVRRLPPNLPEDIFWQSVQPWVTEETASWKIYYPGKLRKKLNKENVPSRAYIAFRNEDQLALFSREYDGHVFRDKAGNESQAVVEFAPYPKVPSEKRKPDNRNATIEKDEDYISFLESLKASENPEPVSLESLIASSQPPPPPKTTPLLEALKAEKSANRDKEAILRNHAHYQTASSFRKEEKKKANAPLPPSKSSEPAPANPGSSKKGSKKGAGASGNPESKPSKSSAQASKSASNAANNAAAPNQATTKPPKPPRAPRPPPAAKQEGRTANPTTIAVPPTPPPDGSGAGSPAAPAAPPRRTRPVIGLASRQFEAALSGVAGLAGAATERKKREKEREKDKEAKEGASSNAAARAPATFARIDSSEPERPPPPQSPKKEKTRRGGRGGGGGGGNASEAPQVKVPSILQRADVPPVIRKEGPAGVVVLPEVPTGPSGSGSSAPRGGGRRGRGGGRGRGGSGSGGGGGGGGGAPKGG